MQSTESKNCTNSKVESSSLNWLFINEPNAKHGISVVY